MQNLQTFGRPRPREVALVGTAASVIFVTGDTVDAETQRFLRRTGRPVLTKPFSRDSLLATLAPFLATSRS